MYLCQPLPMVSDARARGPHRLLAIAVAIVLGACAGSDPSPTAPTKAPKAAESPAKPAVLIVAIDGLRSEDAARADTPNLDRLAEAGAFTPEAQAVMPTMTRTNFVTFATGAYADEHGIIGGLYLNGEWEEHQTDKPSIAEAQKRVPVPTIFEAAEAEGFRTGILGMKGYELVGARGATVQEGGGDIFPAEIWEDRYDPQDGGSIEEAVRRRLRKNDVIVDRLEEVVEDQPLDLILINIGATDYIAHTQGPESEHYTRAIEESDSMIPRIRKIARSSNPDRRWHTIVIADHGFSQTRRDQMVVPHLEDVFEVQELKEAGIEHRIYERGGRAAEVYTRDDGDVVRAAEILDDLPWVERLYADRDVPGRAGTYDDLRVAYPGRRGSLYVITDRSYAFAYPNLGQHGSNDPSDMNVPLWIAGPNIAAAKLDLADAENTDIGPTALALLGIDPDEALEASGHSLVPAPAER